MIDLISLWVTSRDELNARCMFAFVVLFIMAFIWRAFLKPSVERWKPVEKGLAIWFRVLCLAVIAAVIAEALLYFALPVYLDPYEASVASVSGLVGQSVPLYHPIDAPARYVQMGYGPALYFIDYAFARVFGLTMQASKAASVFSFIGSLLLMARAVKRPTSRIALLCPQGLAAAAGLALALDYFGHQAFWTRGDPIIVFCVVVGVWALEERILSPRAKAVVFGFAIGVAINLKITSVVYFAPLLVVAFAELGWRNIALASATAIVAVALPFCLPTVSLRNYLSWFLLMKRQGYGDWNMRYWHAKRAFFWVTPVVLAWVFAAIVHVTRRRLPPLDARRRARSFISMVVSVRRHIRLVHAYFAATCVTFIVLVFIASKPGSTEHHYLPFFPVLIHAMVRMAPRDVRTFDMRAVTGLAMGTLLFFTDFTASRLLAKRMVIMRPTALDMQAEVQSFIQAHPGKTIEMGGAASISPMYYRVLLVYAKMPYRIDIGTLMDLGSIGEPTIPASLHERLKSCETDYFLLQAQSSPFRVTSVYTGQPAYDEIYRQDFINSYIRTEQMRYFDVWSCRHPVSSDDP